MDALVPIVIMTGMFALIFGIVYLKNKENMSLIEKGINPRTNASAPRPFAILKYGLLLVGAGSGLLAAYIINVLIAGQSSFASHGGDFSATLHGINPALYFALIAIGGGLGLYFSYRIEKKEWLDKKND